LLSTDFDAAAKAHRSGEALLASLRSDPMGKRMAQVLLAVPLKVTAAPLKARA
jgi:hypothetical protein